MKKPVSLALFSALLLTSFDALAAGQMARAWVSAKIGSDTAGCGGATTPCRSFQYAFSNAVVAGGSILVLDPGGYGAVTITNAVSIINDGVGAAGIFTNAGTSIAIAAGAKDSVVIKGLTIDGGGTALNGILVQSAGKVTVSDCFIHGFGSSLGYVSAPDYNGIRIASSTSLAFDIDNTIVADTADDGISIDPPVSSVVFTGTVRRVQARNNAHAGLALEELKAVAQNITLTIEDSAFTHNGDEGVISGQPNSAIYAVRTNASANGYAGFFATDGSTIVMANSVALKNGTFDYAHQNANMLTAGGNLVGTGDFSGTFTPK